MSVFYAHFCFFEFIAYHVDPIPETKFPKAPRLNKNRTEEKNYVWSLNIQ